MPLDTKQSAASGNIDAAIEDPAAHFTRPQDILTDPRLTKELRLQLLQRWEQDAELLEAAANEGMRGGEESMLQRVKQALLAAELAMDDEINSSLKTTVKNVADGLTDAATRVRDVASRTHRGTVEVREMIRSQPVTAAISIFILGYMVGRIGTLFSSPKR
jgi:Fe-S cluster assembly ATPase SufC